MGDSKSLSHQEIRHLMEFQDTLLSLLEEGILYLDAAGMIQLANPAALQILGYAAEELYHYRLDELHRPSQLEQHSLHLLQAYGQSLSPWQALTWYARAQEPEKHEWDYRCRDGSWRPVFLALYCLRDQSTGAINGYIGILQDLSQSRQDQVKLEAARRHAETANQAKNRFLAHVTHELRSPMSSILGFSRLLLDDPHLDREQRPALEAISRSAGHLMLLINNMLDLSKIEFGRVELQPSLFELPDLVNALGYEFMIGAQAKGLGFRLEGLKDLPSVVIADETKLRQILLNLVGNAIKFTRQGEVSLKIWYQAHQYLEALPAHLGAASCGNLWIEVQDTGSGISELDLQKLFSPFEQSASGQIFAEGVGLGLAIAKAYVDLMGGQIQVESQVGRGTRFALWVAISEGPARHVLEDQALSLAAPSSPDAPPPPRILILDAMSDSLQLAGRWLMSLGCEVRIVLRPEDLDQVIPTWQPQVLCLDVYRTPWDSRALVQKWRPAFGGLLWAMDVLEAEPQPSWLHLGCDALLSKPLSRRYLRQLLHDQLGMEPQKDPQLMTQTLSIFNLSYDWNKVDVKIRAELAEAVRLCERRRVQVLLNEIRPVEPALAEILDEYSKNFRFDLIEHLLEKPGSGEATHG